MQSLVRLVSGMLLGIVLAPSTQAATTLVAPGAGSTWQYLDRGHPAPPTWNSSLADAAAWKTGAAPLGYGDPGPNTTLSFGRHPERKPITVYFRRQVDVQDAAGVAALTLDLRRDDGVVIYWNGVEIVRDNMPAGAISPNTLAVQAIDGERELEYRRWIIPAASLPLHDGANLLAVELHQVNPTSSDAMFDLEILAYAPSEALPRDPYPAAFDAVVARDIDLAVDLLLQLDRRRAGYAQLAMRATELFLAKGGSPNDPRYWRLLDSACEAAPDDMETVYAWVHAHVAARKGLTVQLQHRTLPAQIPERWRFIADTPEIAVGKLLPRQQLLADIDDLELLLENCYAYLERRGADYRGALDALRASITSDLSAATFAHRVTRMLTVFGDPHIQLRHPAEPRAAVRFVMDGERIAALHYDRRGLLDSAHPYVSLINGQPAAQWLAAAEQLVSQASPQYRRVLALEQLRKLGVVARQMKLPSSGFTLTLSSANGNDTAQLSMPLSDRNPAAPPSWPAHQSELRGDNIGYLRIATMDSGPAFTNMLDRWMTQFAGTRGLIIDVRGNGGGQQDALRAIASWLMKPGSPMRIVNVAAYRLPVAPPSANGGGFLGRDDRGLYPSTSAAWSTGEAAQVRIFLKSWHPASPLPAGKFSDWHVMAVKASDTHGYFDKPVLVLQDEEDFSATDNFLGALKGLPNVTLMGMASGGGSGRMAGYVLPNSRLELSLPQMASYNNDGQTYDGNGVQPDLMIAKQLGDQVKGGGDSLLDAAVARLLHATGR